MSRVVHFEFATPDPAKEMEFFKDVFGWEATRWGDVEYWPVDTGKEPIGINGAFAPLRSPDQPRVTAIIGVGDLDDSLAKAAAAGATLAMEKTEVPGVGWTAYLISPTGILFGMIEPMPGSMPTQA